MKGITPGFARRFLGLLEAGTFLCILFPLLGLFGRYHWTLDLLTHFRIQYFATLAVCAIVCALSKRTRPALVSAAAAIILSATLVPYYFPRAADNGPGDLKVISHNVFTANNRVDDVLAFLKQESADIVFLMEVNRHWAERLRSLSGIYPHIVERPREDNFGVMLLSKHPFLAQDVRIFGSIPVPTIVATIDVHGSQLEFVGTHPTPPAGREGSLGRNGHLRELAQALAPPHPEALVLAGDLNTTPFSGVYTRFLRDSGLRDSSPGFGITPTWMRSSPWFAIPIDHLLLSEHLAVHDRRVGPACGSDHSPLIVELSLAK